MFDKLVVNRKRHVFFSKIFEEKHEKFRTSSQHPIAQKINHFTISDVELIACPQNSMSGNEFHEWIAINNRVPLDIYHARAIYLDTMARSRITNLSADLSWRKSFSLETINFLGSIVSNKKGEHVVCFEYRSVLANGSGLIFMCYNANEDGWSQFHDLAAVFKKESVEKLLSKNNKNK